MPKLNSQFFLVVIFLLFTGLILSPGLSGPYIYDDHKNLKDFTSENLRYVDAIFENKAGPLGRSITMATFVVNHWVKGELTPYDLKLTNLFIHLINGMLLFYLISILLKIKLSEKKARLYAALLMGLWLITPVNSGVVFYIIQRATLLATTFMLVASIAYVKYRVSSQQSAFKKLILIGLCTVSWLIAMFSKENAVLLPLILLCIEVCFFNTIDVRQVKLKTVAIWMPVISFVFFLFVFILNHHGFIDYSDREFSLLERLYTQSVVLLVYIQEILFPITVDVSLHRGDDLTIRKSFWNYATVSSSIIIIGLILTSLLLLKHEKYKYTGTGVLVFFIGHLLESSIFPLELFFHHRNYFPSIGLYLSLILFLDLLIVKYKLKKIMPMLFVFYFSLLGLQGYAQAKVWSSYDSILLNNLKNHPEAMGGNLVIIGELVKRKDIQSSLSISNTIIESRPARSFPLKIQRFYIYCELADNIPMQEYEILDKDLNLIKAKLISLALSNFLQSYKNNQCNFIDIQKIINSLTLWTGKQLFSSQYTSSDLWSIDYYMVEFLLLLGKREAAVKLLDSHVNYGNPKALFYKQEIQKM